MNLNMKTNLKTDLIPDFVYFSQNEKHDVLMRNLKLINKEGPFPDFPTIIVPNKLKKRLFENNRAKQD